MIKLDFSGQVVAVSGGAIGFGRAIAELFASHGAQVFACDIVAPPDAIETYTLDTVDLLDRRVAARWISSVEARSPTGGIDVLVCNAGGVAGQASKAFETVTDEEWDKVIDINLTSTFTLCRAAVPAMKSAGRGSIITITSGAALQASWTGVQAYCSSKHAVLGLTRQLAHDLGPFGIRVNSVAPGFVRTNAATERQWAAYGPEKQRQLIEGVAMKRLGTPEEIAKSVLFLASDLASFVNGQLLQVDGGK